MSEEYEEIKVETGFKSSTEINKIFEALSKCQGQMESAKKDSENPFFKSSYADLSSCWETLRKPLTDNGLSVIQLPMEGKDSLKLTTILGHNSGQWISSLIEVTPTKRDPQGLGSALTYARRYALMAITGIAPEDDDGNSGSDNNDNNNKKQPPKRKSENKQEENSINNNGLSDKQMKRLFAISKQQSWTEKDIKIYYKSNFDIESSKELTREQYDEICDYMTANSNGFEG